MIVPFGKPMVKPPQTEDVAFYSVEVGSAPQLCDVFRRVRKSQIFPEKRGKTREKSGKNMLKVFFLVFQGVFWGFRFFGCIIFKTSYSSCHRVKLSEPFLDEVVVIILLFCLRVALGMALDTNFQVLARAWGWSNGCYFFWMFLDCFFAMFLRFF